MARAKPALGKSLGNAKNPKFTRIGDRLLTLVLLAILPLLGLAGFLMLQNIQSGRGQLREQLQLRARALTEAVDRELGIHRAIIVALQHSAALQAEDWRGFRSQVEPLMRAYPWAHITVITSSGQILFGDIMPSERNLLQRAIETGEPQTSDYADGTLTQGPVISTYFPLGEAGHPDLILAISCAPSRFQDIVDAQRQSRFIRAAIIDNRNIYIARAGDPPSAVGRPGPLDLFGRTQTAAEGVETVKEKDGTTVLAAFYHSRISNWTIVAGFDEAAALGFNDRSFVVLGVGGSLLIVISLLSAFWYGRRIATQTSQLANQAKALGKGELSQPWHFDILEMENVAEELRAAAGLLADDKRERDNMLDQLERRVCERTQELSASEERYRLLAENSLDVIVQGNFEGHRCYVSPAALKLFGYNPDELLDNPILSVVHPDETRTVGQILDRLKQGVDRILADYRVRRKDGTYIWCEGAFRSLPISSGNPINGFLVTIRDISARKEAEGKAYKAVVEATRANNAKSLFLASMSHELRTPLNAIIGFSEMLAGEFFEPLVGRQVQYVSYIQRSGKMLLTLVNDVLDFASIDGDRARIRLKAVSVDSVFEEVEFNMRPLAEEKQIGLSVQKCGSQISAVLADRERLNQILINLCSNAIKYNRTGGSVCVSATLDEAGWITLSVLDTGYGIPEEKRSAVYEPFNRLGAEAGTIEGTGVGLTICRRLVEAMGGRIGFSSTVGIGSRFFVQLPIASEGEIA